MKKIFLLGMMMGTLMCASLNAATTISVVNKSGSTNDYLVEESGKLSFSESDLLINQKSGSETIKVDISGIRKITFKATPTNVKENASGQLEFTAFPNPVKDVLFLVGVNAGETVSIYAANGSLVKSVAYSEEGLNLSSLPVGSYLVSVSGKSVKINKI